MLITNYGIGTTDTVNGNTGVIPGARIGAGFTIAASDRVLRMTVGAGLGVVAGIYAVGEIIAWT